MPRLASAERVLSRSLSPDELEYDVPASIPPTQTKEDEEDEEAEEQLEQELVDSTEAKSEKKVKGRRKQKAEPVMESDEEVNGDAKDEDEFTVEAIVGHVFKGKRCYYKVRWEGWSEADDTWEPEEHLLPDAAAALAEYHEKIGGTPQPPKPVRKTPSKANLKAQPSRMDDEDTSEQPSAKRAKRSHRTHANRIDIHSKEYWNSQPLVDYAPTDKVSWEDLVHDVETVERDDEGNLHAYIRFKNGKRSKVANNLYTSRCPRALLRFYESHLSV